VRCCLLKETARQVSITTSDGEYFPVKARLLRPCLALTSAVQSGKGAQPREGVGPCGRARAGTRFVCERKRRTLRLKKHTSPPFQSEPRASSPQHQLIQRNENQQTRARQACTPTPRPRRRWTWTAAPLIACCSSSRQPPPGGLLTCCQSTSRSADPVDSFPDGLWWFF